MITFENTVKNSSATLKSFGYYANAVFSSSLSSSSCVFFFIRILLHSALVSEVFFFFPFLVHVAFIFAIRSVFFFVCAIANNVLSFSCDREKLMQYRSNEWESKIVRIDSHIGNWFEHFLTIISADDFRMANERKQVNIQINSPTAKLWAKKKMLHAYSDAWKSCQFSPAHSECNLIGFDMSEPASQRWIFYLWVLVWWCDNNTSKMFGLAVCRMSLMLPTETHTNCAPLSFAPTRFLY